MQWILVAQIVSVVFFVIFLVHGVIINSSILTMYIRLWRKVTSPGVNDQILFSMALTGLLLHCLLLINSILITLQANRETYAHLLFLPIYALSVIYIMSFWNTAWLSICYCVKLVNTSHRLLLQFKAWFLSSIKKLLVGSAVTSVLIMLPFFWTNHMTFLQNTTFIDGPLGFKMEMNVYYGTFMLLIGYLLPFTLTVLCIGLSVLSLLVHVWRVRQNVSQFSSSPQLQALVRAVVTMTLRVMLDQNFLIVIVYTYATSFMLQNAATIIIGLYLLAYPSMQSFVLFFGNPKLKRIFLWQESTSEVII